MLDSNLLEVTKEGVAEAAALLGCVADPIRLGLVTTLAKRSVAPSRLPQAAKLAPNNTKSPKRALQWTWANMGKGIGL